MSANIPRPATPTIEASDPKIFLGRCDTLTVCYFPTCTRANGCYSATCLNRLQNLVLKKDHPLQPATRMLKAKGLDTPTLIAYQYRVLEPGDFGTKGTWYGGENPAAPPQVVITAPSDITLGQSTHGEPGVLSKDVNKLRPVIVATAPDVAEKEWSRAAKKRYRSLVVAAEEKVTSRFPEFEYLNWSDLV
ncbi:MAG: hypothetical protein LQ345_000925 [Seirophora villosa]|nr:MAG: hypothetical protein LQ345_000925 [Seirophora villosa]